MSTFFSRIALILALIIASIFAQNNDLNIPPIDTNRLPIDTTFLKGDTLIVKGTVKDSLNVPLANCNVTVYLTGSGFGTGSAITDASGNYEITLINNGASKIVNAFATLKLNSGSTGTGTATGSVQEPADGKKDIVVIDITIKNTMSLNTRVSAIQRNFKLTTDISQYSIDGRKMNNELLVRRAIVNRFLLTKSSTGVATGHSIKP